MNPYTCPKCFVNVEVTGHVCAAHEDLGYRKYQIAYVERIEEENASLNEKNDKLKVEVYNLNMKKTCTREKLHEAYMEVKAWRAQAEKLAKVLANIEVYNGETVMGTQALAQYKKWKEKQ